MFLPILTSSLFLIIMTSHYLTISLNLLSFLVHTIKGNLYLFLIPLLVFLYTYSLCYFFLTSLPTHSLLLFLQQFPLPLSLLLSYLSSYLYLSLTAFTTTYFLLSLLAFLFHVFGTQSKKSACADARAIYK